MPLKMQVAKKPYGMDTVMGFGMYKDYRVRDVLDEDPSYLIWAYETIADFGLDEDIYWKATEAVEDNIDRVFRRNILSILRDQYIDDAEGYIDPYDYCD